MKHPYRFTLLKAAAFAAAILAASLGAGGASAQGFNLAPVQVMDPKAGLPIFTIGLPPGWTYSADSVWDRRFNPSVNFHMSAKSPDGTETFTIFPVLGFVDGISGVQNQKVMMPSQFGHYYIDRLKRSDPQFAALNYRIVEARDHAIHPQAAQRNMRIAEGTIKGEYTENGVPKTEMILITIFSGVSNGITTWGANLVAISGKRGNDNALAQKLTAIWSSRRMNPQWEQRQAAMIQQHLAENAREQQAGLANQQAQWNTLKERQLAQGEAMRRQQEERMKTQERINAARQGVISGRADALGRNMEKSTDAIVGRDNRINPYDGTQFKSDVNTGNVWVNEHGQRIGTNDSTYNPNYDSNVSGSGGEYRQAPKGY
ncbi:MAG: hypothetical protein LBR95_03435 [Azoarcus sp.]|jgi:hypothetical protein|nr:hypothetical protein [Azoarcus sp.]